MSKNTDDLEDAVSKSIQGVNDLRQEVQDLNAELTKTKALLHHNQGMNESLVSENKRLRDKVDYYMRWNTELTINCTNAANLARSLIVTIDDGMAKARLAVNNGKSNGEITDTQSLQAVAAAIETEIAPAKLPDAPNIPRFLSRAIEENLEIKEPPFNYR